MIRLLTLFMCLLICYGFQGVWSTPLEMTWIDAALKCYSEGSVLESNLTVLSNYMENNNLHNIWIGSYSAFLSWIEIIGCFYIPKGSDGVTELTTVKASTPDCQIKCFGSKYFALRKHENSCACFSNPVYVHVDTEEATECNNRDKPSFAFVYEAVDNPKRSSNDMENCFQSSCSYEMVESRSTAICSDTNKAVCRNLMTPPVRTDLSFYEYVMECENHGAFPFLSSQNICNYSNHVVGTPYWLGVYRQELMVEHMDINDFSQTDFENHQQYIQKCNYLAKNGDTRVEKCTARTIMSLCKTDFTENGDNGQSSTGMTHQTPEQKVAKESATYTGVIVGTLVTVITIATTIAALLIYRRRKHSKPPKSSFESDVDNHTNSHQGTEDLRNGKISNPGYSSANPLEKEEPIHKEEHNSSKMRCVHDSLITDGIRKLNSNSKASENTSVSATYAKPFRKVNKEIIKEEEEGETPNYSLAEVVNEEYNDPYTSSKHYDHLHNVKKKENQTYKVYDHLTMPVVSDPTYDHMHLNTSTLSDNDYDHFTGKDGK